MPSPLYDNAWLRAREAARRFTGPGEGMTTTDIVPAGVRSPNLDQPFNETGGVDPLEAAKAFLAAPSVTTPNVRTMAEAEKRYTAPKVSTGEVAGHLAKQLPRDVSRGAAALGGLAQLAALPVGYLAGPVAGAGLYAGGELAQAPENIWKGVENPEQAMGYGEGAARIGGLLLELAGLRKFGPKPPVPESGVPSASNLRQTFGARVNEEVPYRVPGGAGVELPPQTRYGGGRNTPSPKRTSPASGPFREGVDAPMADLLTRSEGTGNVRDPWVSARDFAQGWTPNAADLKPALNTERAARIRKHFPTLDEMLADLRTRAKTQPPRTGAERAGFPQVEADAILARAAEGPQRASAQALDDMVQSVQHVEPGVGPTIETPGWNARQIPLSEVPESEAARLKRVITGMQGSRYASEASGDVAGATRATKAINKAQMHRRLARGKR